MSVRENWFQRQRRMSSTASKQRQATSAMEDGDNLEPRNAAQTQPQQYGSRRKSRAFSITAGSSLPGRSYIHNANHGTSNDIQYSSAGVREQTALLSSSFLSDSDVQRHFEYTEDPDSVTLPGPRLHEPIQERSEPVSPTDIERQLPTPSDLSVVDNSLSSYASIRGRRRRSTPSSQHHGDGNMSIPDVVVTDEDDLLTTESTSLLPRARLSSHRERRYDSIAHVESQNPPPPPNGIWNRFGHHYPSLHKVGNGLQVLSKPGTWSPQAILHAVVLRPAGMVPSVFLGVLLNLLDALSYGIILFPLGEEIFSAMGADGVSMFYVSCIVSQLVYSTGSIFRGGVGSEMIEVVPFFHKMTYMIMEIMGTDNPSAVRATVITSYAMSSIVTGVVFFLLGSARLGNLVNFFPHSILVGCIGGVGIFLFLTGIEVSVRLDGNMEFTKEVFDKLIQPYSLAQWLPPLFLAILLLVIKRYYDRPFLVPTFYIAITAIFYIVVLAIPSLTMEKLRDSGWVFAAPEAGVAFYNFYTHYQFQLVDWSAVAKTIPSQLALTFFGILHVPINVPNLALKMQEDNVSINRELIMHGISNTLSGCIGSIQNYLVYVNSVLFMDTGGDSRLAGYMLAAATAGLWVAGPVVIGYVPVMVVGTLIYYLGIDLAKEALFDTLGRLHRLEYLTILIIALVMGVYDFVVGVAIGIGMACLVYVVQTSRKSVIRAQFSGAVAESTVRRHLRQRTYLHRVGPQIRVVKLGGYLFFGSIVNVEKTVRALIDAEAFAACPIRYLVLDFGQVSGIDFSAAEAFVRMNRVLHRRGVETVLAGVNLKGEVGKCLQMDGLFEENDEDPSPPPPKVFEDLNGALEACENAMLLDLTEKQEATIRHATDSPPIPIPADTSAKTSGSSISQPLDVLTAIVGSPRAALRHQAATQTISERNPLNDRHKWTSFPQPLPLLLQAFQDLTTHNEDFWTHATPYFTRRAFPAGAQLYARHDPPNGFYLLQSGILRAEYYMEQGSYRESIVAGTTCGELPFFSDTERTSSVVAEQDCVTWVLTPERWQDLQKEKGELAQEMLRVAMKLSAERMNAITSYVLITAS